MKTAISLPDDLFDAAERVAARLALSRSQLYARTLEVFVREHEGRAITRKIDEALAGASPRLDAVLRRIQSASLGEDGADGGVGRRRAAFAKGARRARALAWMRSVAPRATSSRSDRSRRTAWQGPCGRPA